MPIALAFLFCVLTWGSTWYAIEWQLGYVAKEWSLTYRYALAALIMVLWCLYKRKPMRFDRVAHLYMAATGLLLFSGNYILVYYGTEYLTSGLVAVTFALLSFCNIINARLFVGMPIRVNSLAAALLGVLGLVFVFSPEIDQLNFADGATLGLSICIMGTVIASLGNTTLLTGKVREIPLLSFNAWGMAYGTLWNLIFALVSGEAPSLDPRAEYYLALGFLALFGTVIAFTLYIWLIGKLGPANAGYIPVLTPLVALVISTFFEGYSWTVSAGIGVTLVMLGNLLMVLDKRKSEQKLSSQ